MLYSPGVHLLINVNPVKIEMTIDHKMMVKGVFKLLNSNVLIRIINETYEYCMKLMLHCNSCISVQIPNVQLSVHKSLCLTISDNYLYQKQH